LTVYLDIPFWNEKDGLEFEQVLDKGVFDSEMIFPVVVQAFVQRGVLRGDFGGVACPDGFGLVLLLVFGIDFLDLRLLLRLVLVLVDIFDL
jgi:hypothetical protein